MPVGYMLFAGFATEPVLSWTGSILPMAPPPVVLVAVAKCLDCVTLLDSCELPVGFAEMCSEIREVSIRECGKPCFCRLLPSACPAEHRRRGRSRLPEEKKHNKAMRLQQGVRRLPGARGRARTRHESCRVVWMVLVRSHVSGEARGQRKTPATTKQEDVYSNSRWCKDPCQEKGNPRKQG